MAPDHRAERAGAVSAQVALDLLFGAWVAQFGDLAGELSGVADAVVPALVQMFVVTIEDVRALPVFRDQGIDRCDGSELADCCGMQAQLAADGGFAESLAQQPMNCRVMLPETSNDLELNMIDDHRCLTGCPGGVLFGQRCSELAADHRKVLLNGLAEVLP